MSAIKPPVFFDPSGWRKRIWVGLLRGVLALGVVAAVFLVVNILFVTELEEVPGAVPVAEPGAADGAPLARVERTGRLMRYEPVEARATRRAGRATRRLAFVDVNDGASMAALERAAERLDGVVANLLSIERRDTRIMLRTSPNAGRVRDVLQAQGRAVPLYVSLDVAHADLLAIARHSNGRDQLAAELGRRLERLGAAGLAISPAPGSAGHGAGLLPLLQRIRGDLGEHGLKLLLDVGQDDATGMRLGREIADLVLVRFFSTAWREDGEAQSLAAFRARLNAATEIVPRDRLVPVLGSFALRWSPATGTRVDSVQSVWSDLAALERVPDFRRASGASRAATGAGEATIRDAATVFNQFAAVRDVAPTGVAVWRLGLADPQVWKVLTLADRGEVADLLRDMVPGEDLPLRSEDLAFFRAGGSRDGRRQVIYDADLDLVVGQSIERLPVPLMLEKWEVPPSRKVALTFDDGPHPVYTPQILDVLKAHDVKATFYVVGSAAASHPDLVRRIYDEGHDLGNHTYSHADIYRASEFDLLFETNRLQRLVEAIAGVRIALLRPPYLSERMVELYGSAPTLRALGEHGYVIAGYDINSFDWRPRHGAQDIAALVVGEVRAGLGRQVLFHDGGADTGATVAALPIIIEALREDGYELVTTHELLGVSRETLMAPVEGSFLAPARLAAHRAIVGLNAGLTGTVTTLAIVLVALAALRLLAICAGALVAERRRRRRGPGTFRGSVAVIVPAYNEEAVICRTVAKLLQAKGLGDWRIIVVDDGSTDRTLDVARAAFADEPRVAIVAKANGGKASAINAGLARATSDVVVIIDADTRVAEDALARLLGRFDDPAVGAVAGNVYVANTINLVTRMQAIEYVGAQNLDRRAFEVANGIGVVPGAIGAWRTAALRSIGGFSDDTLAEDADATVALLQGGWRIICEPTARSYTEAPETVRAFLKQRFRWCFGTLQVAYKLVRRPSGPFAPGVAFVVLPNIFLFQYATGLIAPVVDVMLVFSLAGAIATGTTTEFAHLAIFWAAFQVMDLSIAALGVYLDRSRVWWRFLPIVLLQRVLYRPLIYITLLRSLFAALTGRLVGWNKLVRSGNAVSDDGERIAARSGP